MNERERYLETLLFGKPDKIPFEPGGPRESTLKAWHKQGLPEGVNWQEYLREKIGIEPLSKDERTQVWLKSEMNPEFEEKIIEKKENSLIVQDWKGNICEISKEFDITYLRSAKDFVTRRWVRCPVENRNDWEDMKKRYNPDDPDRIPEDIIALGKQIADRDYVTGIHFSGPFWQLREWLGFEKLCMGFIDDAQFLKEMVSFWKDYISRLLEKILPYVKVDYVHISEDMAYKGKSMISLDMASEFLQTCYCQWNEVIKATGCLVYDMDSDGYIAELVPIWVESGINVCNPIEVAAGNDINQLRGTFGKKIAFRGGVDKRAMAKGGSIIEKEMARLEPVIKTGGYIPSCDHGVPSDVSWDAFLKYSRILAHMTGWK